MESYAGNLARVSAAAKYFLPGREWGAKVGGAAILLPLYLAVAVSLLLALALVAAAVIDLHQFRLPDAITLPLIAAGLGLAALSPAPALAERLVGAGAGFALLAALGAVHFRWRGREGLGLGDAKLFAATGAWLGWQALPWVLALAAGGALIWAVALRRSGAIAFGPWLALAFWVLWLAQISRTV